MHLYLSLKALLLDGGSAADRLNEALDPPTPVLTPETEFVPGTLAYALFHCERALTVTLDLFEVGTVLSVSDEQTVASEIADVIFQHCAYHGFCICRCSEIGIWQEAVGNSQLPRLLHWPAFAVQPGAWQVFGKPLPAMDADILNHLCRLEWSTAEQIARDGQVVSQRLRFTSATMPTIAMQLALGRVPHGPDDRGGPYPPDVLEIEQRLGRMNREGLLTSPSPRSHGYRIVRPTSPPERALTIKERIHPS
jgi:hypothetical protein